LIGPTDEMRPMTPGLNPGDDPVDLFERGIAPHHD
jgi:hypothetical protein